MKLVFLRKPDAEPKQGDKKRQDSCVDVGVEGVRLVLLFACKKESPMEAVARGRYRWQQLSAPPSSDDAISSKFFGVAEGQEDERVAWQRTETHDVCGWHGH